MRFCSIASLAALMALASVERADAAFYWEGLGPFVESDGQGGETRVTPGRTITQEPPREDAPQKGSVPADEPDQK